MKSLYTLAACVVIAVWAPAATGQTVSKEKKVSGRFSADRGKLLIDNSYGKLHINTWDKDEVTVDITITAKSKSAGAAQELLDKVSIIEPKNNGSDIYYKTVIGKDKSAETKGEFRIDYVINMPRWHTAAFKNKFGDIDIADVHGKLQIDLEYGDLKAGAMRGSDKDITVGFGSATITSIETGNIRSSYSKLSIDKGGSLKVLNQFGKTNIGTVRDLVIDQKYGDLKIGSVNQLKGEAKFAGVTVDKLLKSMQMTVSHSGEAKFEYVGPDVDYINVNSSFSNLYCYFDKAASLTANVEVSFGNVNNSGGNISVSRSKSGNPGQTSNSYHGKIGSGKGSLVMHVSYGNVVFK
jgi:hypothetical protein